MTWDAIQGTMQWGELGWLTSFSTFRLQEWVPSLVGHFVIPWEASPEDPPPPRLCLPRFHESCAAGAPLPLCVLPMPPAQSTGAEQRLGQAPKSRSSEGCCPRCSPDPCLLPTLAVIIILGLTQC